MADGRSEQVQPRAEGGGAPEDPPIATSALESPASASGEGLGDPAGTSSTRPLGVEVETIPPTKEAGGPVGPTGNGPPAVTESQPAPPPAKRKKGRFAFLGELPALIVIAFLLALLIKTFLIQAFYIPSESMLPTLHVGDRVLVNKVVYHLHPPRRGDIIVFSDPHPTEVVHRNPFSAFFHWLTEGLGVQTDPTKDFIKRVIGLPGETVAFEHCQIMINGKPLNEPYATVKDCNDEYAPHRVPADSLFVMGDNRPNSNDSRMQLGFVPEDKVIGRAFVIIWPPSRIGWLHGLVSVVPEPAWLAVPA